MKSGYTLTEFLFAIIIIVILAGLAVPAYQSLATHVRVTTQVNQLITAINFARSEAIKRHTMVSICNSKDGQSCGGTWREGWLIFVDKQANGKVSATDQILRVYSALPVGDRLHWQTTVHKNDYLQFTASGSPRGQAGSFIYCPAGYNPQHIYVISVSLTGRVRRSSLATAEVPLICGNA